ncbi:UNKNOWN [Stylonychia lemnae]|uniref:CUB domain-containing protein n=1 Tax=Stylonychia lemnae TaxID=5949 RepID=A0A078A5U2_STYLE|nr:UNKNOWN [Stylonychia lemnae]|eukprot:CDW76129.1 UNKNOWN [Stylonychia lemnae]
MIYLVFLLSSTQVNSYTASSNCMSCLSASTNNKFCMTSWLSSSGYCCDKSNTNDYCSSSRYLCSDAAPNDAMKLSFCPFSQSLCFDKAQTTLTDNSIHTAATSNTFGKDNVCAWKIKTVSDYYFNKKISVEIKIASNVNCYIAFGESMLKATQYSACKAGSSFVIDANQHVFVIAQGLTTAAQMQFNYQMKDSMDFMYLIFIYSGSLFTFLLLISALMVALIWKWVKSLIIQNQIFWQKIAAEMSATVLQVEKLKKQTTSYQSHSHQQIGDKTNDDGHIDIHQRQRSAVPMDDYVIPPPPPIIQINSLDDNIYPPVRLVDYNSAKPSQQQQRASSRPQPIKFNL